MSDTQHTQATLAYAIALLVNIESAVARFGYRAGQLDTFLQGHRPIPSDLFLAAADIVLSATREQIDQAQKSMQGAPKGINSEGLQKFLERETGRGGNPER